MTLVILNDCGNKIRWEIRLFDRSVCEVVVDVDAIDDLEAVDDVDAVDVAFSPSRHLFWFVRYLRTARVGDLPSQLKVCSDNLWLLNRRREAAKEKEGKSVDNMHSNCKKRGSQNFLCGIYSCSPVYVYEGAHERPDNHILKNKRRKKFIKFFEPGCRYFFLNCTLLPLPYDALTFNTRKRLPSVPTVDRFVQLLR